MGYNSWYDVQMGPSAELVEATAQAMASNGLQAAGYKYINLDDGIVQTTRDANGNLIPDPKFPQGFIGLADFLHAKGYLFGVYTDRGPITCGHRMGAQGNEAKDAAWYAAQGIDYVKEDSCAAPSDHQTAYAQYAAMRDGLNATGRSLFFSLCGWNEWYSPVMRALANSARIGPDDSNWNGLLVDIDDMLTLNPYAGPGAWNDPCLLLGEDQNGNAAVTELQGRFQFTAWAVLAAPLLLSQNVRNLSSYRLETYLNEEVIGVNQDIFGRQGQLLAGGHVSMAPRALNSHMARRFNGSVPDPRSVFSKKDLSVLHGRHWGSDGQAPLTLTACAAVTSQQWQWNVSAPGYLTNVATQLCANIDNCGTAIIGYTCVTSGGTCCGSSCYAGLQFFIAADGTFRSPSQPTMCVTNMGAGQQAALAPCQPGLATQQFTYDAAAQTIAQSTADGKQCLTVGTGAEAAAVIGRPLVDGSWAVAFLNAGPFPVNLTCGAGCLNQTGWEPEQVLAVRDLWAHEDLPDILASGSLSPSLPADGGVALYKLTPKFNTTIPTAE